ncbi:DNA-binding response regulator [Paenibacillus pectinilyticus]|uniref:DNA-binding response regulator n=1 Tax=Paenibacillus pectinilyticus TaxID=512399 RepID=A0A1C0ZRI7_9BACL|nr:response regulator [Paenibacillus pectinilyticus]OCT10682.1 DNA-binding response regulator [Paenibacillus pectinilyticus]
MKVLLVDDEKHVRDAIRLLVNWKLFGIDTILEAQDGEAAIEIVRNEHPEIIMTDMMMPILNGVKLLEWLHRHAPDAKTIVISGHDDFSLLRHTVKYGGTDYILKPIDPDQLNEALDKAIQTWLKEEEQRHANRELNIEVNQFKPIYWDKLLSALIAEPGTYEPVADQLERELHLPRGVANCRVAILSLDTMEASIKNKFSQNIDLLLFSLINICNEFLVTEQRGYAFRHLHNLHEIVLLIWSTPSTAEGLLATINDGIRTTLHTRVDFGIGSAHAFPQQLKLSYQEARDALRQRNLKSKETWIHTTSQSAKTSQTSLTFHQYEEQINLAIRSGNVEQIQDVVKLWIDAVKSSETITPEQLEHWWGEYRVMMRRWVQQFIPNSGENEVNPLLLEESASSIMTLDEKGILSLSLWQQELTRSLVQVSKLHLEGQHKDNNVIFEIASFLEKHYHEDISLADIASRFYLSREYISRKFKQEFQVNLSDYLGQIRMSKAKVLLCNPNLRISQVAEMVGYQDEKYFSKVFKKMSGMTPNEYRKTANSI